MDERVLRTGKAHEFDSFCRRSGILKPYVFLDRSRNDYLTETIKCAATQDGVVLGIDLFRVSCFYRLHIVDEDQFATTRKRFAELFEDRDACRALIEQVRSSRIECLDAAAAISAAEVGANSRSMIMKFITIRQRRARLMYIFELYQRVLTASIMEVLGIAAERISRIPMPDRYHRFKMHRYAFMPTRQTFEVVAHNAYCDLWDLWNTEGESSARYQEAFKKFCGLYGSTDATGLTKAGDPASTVMQRLRAQPTRPTRFQFDAAEVSAAKRQLYIDTIYDFEERDRSLAVSLSGQMQLMEDVLYEESWGRPAVSRLNIAIRPHFDAIEHQLESAGLIASSVFDLDINEFERLLSLVN
jgi:hypothetical protein